MNNASKTHTSKRRFAVQDDRKNKNLKIKKESEDSFPDSASVSLGIITNRTPSAQSELLAPAEEGELEYG